MSNIGTDVFCSTLVESRGKMKAEDENSKQHTQKLVTMQERIAELETLLEAKEAKLKRMEEVLSESEGKYIKLLESLSELCYIADPETFVATYISDSIEQIYGYTAEEWLKDPDLWEKTIHPKDKERVLTEVTDARRKLESSVIEYRIIKKGKTVAWVEDHVSWEKDKDGKIVSILGLIYDITGRKMSEDIVKQQRDWLEVTFSSIGHGVIATDAQGFISFMNSTAENLTGWIDRDARGRHIDEVFRIVNEQTRQDVESPVGRVLREGDVVGLANLTVLISRDGGEISIDYSIAPVRDRHGTLRGSVLIFQDMTMRKQMREEIVEAELTARAARATRAARAVIEGMIDPVITTDIEGRVVQFNKALTETLGWGEEVIGELPTIFITERDIPKFTEVIKEGFEKGYIKNLEHTGVTKDGREVPVLVSVSLLKDTEGKPTGIVIAVKDITDLKRVEEALSKLGQELTIRNQIAEIFLAIADEGIYEEILQVILKEMKSVNGVFGYIDENGALVVPFMTQYIWDNKCQVSHNAAVFPRDMWESSTLSRAIREQRTIYSNEPSTNAAEGHISIRRYISTPILYRGETIGLFHVANKETDYDEEDIQLLKSIANYIAPTLYARLQRDIQMKERERVLEQIRESEEKFRNLAEQSPNMIFINKSGRMVYVNNRCEEIMGYKREEFISPDFDFLALIVPESRDLVRAIFSRHMKGEDVPPLECILLAKDGERSQVILAIKLIQYEGELAFLGTVTDITQRKRAEEKLREYSEALEEKVEQLQDAQEKLIRQEKLALLGQLAGSVGHELRNPLGVIKNAVYYLNMVLRSPGSEVKDMLEILTNEVTISEGIVSDILDFSHTKSPTRRKIDINSVVHQVLSSATVPGNVQVLNQLDEELPVILADPDQLRRVFGNIILNGLQAMPDSGELVVKSGVHSPGWVVVTVTDSGVGIPEENLKKLFEPLFTTKAKGIGLGLAIVKDIVEAHKGIIEVKSKVGEGSTFTVRLPIL